MIERIYAILDKSEKLKLRHLLKVDKEIYPNNACEISMGDWVKIMKERNKMSRRLTNCIAPDWGYLEFHYSCLKNVDKSDIMGLRNAGEKSWEEFEALRKEYFNDINGQDY